jgi:PAS domain-containing protein
MILRAEADHYRTLLLAQPQVLVTWPAGSDQPEIIGDTAIAVANALPERVLAFGTWLEPAAAQRLERAVDALRNEGRAFVMTLSSSAGRALEAEGRAVAGRAVLRLRDVGGIESELMDLASRHDRLASDVDVMTSLLNALPNPVWARDQNDRLIFVNSAYARAVDAEDPADAVKRDLQLLNRATLDSFTRARGAGETFTARVPAIVGGERRIFDVVDAPTGAGSAGMAIDATEMESMRADLARRIDAHRRVLDQLATGVAIFDGERKLNFYNTAFRLLFELDAATLDQSPTDSAILDALRASRKLPEEPDFKQWKRELHEAYHGIETKERLWHLPDGRTLRVVTAPNPEGGVTYLYDDVTERLDMHRRYDALIKVQRETLDHLAEAVAVFGPDGRVRLHNPAFQRLGASTAR